MLGLIKGLSGNRIENIQTPSQVSWNQDSKRDRRGREHGCAPLNSELWHFPDDNLVQQGGKAFFLLISPMIQEKRAPDALPETSLG